MKIEKLMLQRHELDGEELWIFQLCIDDCFFGLSRFFEEPIVESGRAGVPGRFVVLTERRMSRDKPIGESRLVVLDRELKNQWVSPWLSWGKFTEIKLRENRNTSSLLWNLWSRLKARTNIAGRLRFQVVRPRRTFSYRPSFFLLPFPSRDCFSWSNQPVSASLDSRWTQSAVSFDVVRLRIEEEPGPSVSEECWRDITQISIERKVGDTYQWTSLRIFGRSCHTLSIPCRGASRFLDEISNRYGISHERMRQVIDSGESVAQLLWSPLNSETDLIEVTDLRPLSQDEFRDGFPLASGEWIAWSDTLEDLLARRVIRLNNGRPTPLYETTSAVRLGPWLLPRLWIYPSNLESAHWIPNRWHLDFLDFSPALTPDQLDQCVRGLSEGGEFSFDPGDRKYFITGCNVRFSIDYYYGIWRLHIELVFHKYWDHMRRRHPVTSSLNISKFQPFEAVSMACGIGRFDVSCFTSAEMIPTPEPLADFPLVFWEDQTNGWQGIASYVTAHYWRTGELAGLEVHTSSYPNDHGGCYEESVVTVHFKTRRHLRAFFFGTLKIPAREVLDWML